MYNASAGQVAYNASYTNGTARPKPLLRTTSQSRIANSAISWALGFCGTRYELTPDLSLANASADFNLVVIPEGGTENNTLASYDSCFNDDLPLPGSLGDYDLETYIPLYLSDATDRLQQYVPEGFVLDLNDTYAMQSICAYEVGYIGASDFCNLFTEEEWQGFENTLDIEYYYDYAWGNPTGKFLVFLPLYRVIFNQTHRKGSRFGLDAGAFGTSSKPVHSRFQLLSELDARRQRRKLHSGPSLLR